EDLAGNVSDEKQVSFQVDTTGPVTSNLRVTPDTTNGTVSLTGTATDGLNPIDRVEYYIDTLPQGTSAAGIQMSGTGSLQTDIAGTISIAGLKEGKHSVYVRAQDNVGNWGTAQKTTFTISKSKLLVYVTPITPDPLGTTNITISGYAVDVHAPIKQIEVCVDSYTWGTAVITDGSADEFIEEYTYQLPASQLTQGSHKITVKATDMANTLGMVMDTFVIDIATSTLSMSTSPQWASSRVVIIGTATDQGSATGIVEVEYRLDSEQVWQTAIATDGAYDMAAETFQIALSGLIDGTHTVTARSMDVVGNVSDEAVISFQVDTAGPVISNLKVSPDPTNGTSSLTGTATDALNIITKVEYYIDTLPQGTGSQMSGTGSMQTNISGVINTISLTEGKHTVYVRAQDAMGNWGNVQQVVFAVSRSRLFVEINPVTPDPIGTTNITLTGRVIAPQVSIKQVDVQIDGSSWIPAQIADTVADELVEEYACVLPAGSMTDGVHTIVVRAMDIANITGFGTESFEVDVQTPQVNGIMVRYPTGQLRAKEGDVVTIMVQVQDNSGIGSVILDASGIADGLNQVACVDPDEDNVYLAQVTLSDTPMGTELQQAIMIIVEDKAGNQGTGTENVFVDNKPPVFTTVNTPLSVYKNGDTLQVIAVLDSGTVSVDFSGIDSTGSETAAVLAGGTYTINHQIGTANTRPDGSYELKVKARDEAGNISWRSTSVLLDNTAPGQLLKAEPSMLRNGDTIVFTYQAGEQGLRTTEIAASQFDLNAATLTLHDDGVLPDMVQNDGVYTASHTISATNTISGTVIVKAVIVDMAGNTLKPQVSITIDNTLPAVQLGTIAAMQAASSLTIYGTATEGITSITGVEYLLDNIAIWHGATPKDGQFNAGTELFAIVLQGLSEGSHTIAARAKDRCENEGTQTITFCVDTKGPGTISLSLSPETVTTGTSTLLAATITDAINPVVYAEYYIDAYPKPQPDGELDGMFDELTVVIGAIIDVTNLPEGNHIVYVRAQDALRNWSNPQSALFRVGKGGIDVVIETQEAVIGTSTTNIHGYANAFTYKVVSLEYRVGTGTWMGTSSSDGVLNDELKEEFAIWVTGLKQGTNTIEVRAVDEVGNTGTDSVNIVVDITPPSGTRITINDGATYTTSRQVVLHLMYDDEAVFARYTNAAFDENWETPVKDRIWTLPPQDGTYTVYYQVRDEAGNIGEATATITMDTTSPSFITVTSDRTAYRNGDTINLTARMDGAGYVITAWLLPIDSTAVSPLVMTDMGNGTYTLASTISLVNKSPDGSYPILITATDKAGNVKQISVSLQLKNTTPMYGLSVDPALPPVVRNGHMLTFVYAGAETNLPTTTISLNYDGHPNLLQINGSATTDLILLDNGIAPDKVANDGVYMGTCAVNTTIEGTITVYAAIVNSVGNVMNPWTAIRVDNTPPQIDNISVAYSAGQSRAREGDVISINVEVTDAMLSVVKLDAHELNGESAEEMSYNPVSGMYTAQVSVVDTTSGAKTITITAVDEAGNVSTSTALVTIDNQLPRFNMLDTDRSLYKNGWTMTVTAVLDESSYVSADFSGLDNTYKIGTVTPLSSGTHTITYLIGTANTMPNGVYS
ncbi:MAG: choice-of-anchor X domain-containing protein, partial [Candidatus Desantisbacteria bacterium]